MEFARARREASERAARATKETRCVFVSRKRGGVDRSHERRTTSVMRDEGFRSKGTRASTEAKTRNRRRRARLARNPTELYCLRKGFSLEVAFAAVGRAGPHVAPSRGAGRAARPRASRRAVVAFARRRVGNLARGSSRRRPRLAAPIEGGASSSRVSSSRRRTRRAFEREGADAETRRPCEPSTRAMDDAPRSAWSRPARAAPPSPAGP